MTAALTVVLIGVLVLIAACAWTWGPVALAFGGGFLIGFGVFFVDVGPRDRK